MSVTFTENVIISGDLSVSGSVSFGTGVLTNSHVAASAKIEATKVRQYMTHSFLWRGDAITEVIGMGCVNTAVEVVDVRAFAVTPATTPDSVAINVGVGEGSATDVLSSDITLDDSVAAYVDAVGTVKSDGTEDLSAGAVLVADLTLSGTNPPEDGCVTVTVKSNE